MSNRICIPDYEYKERIAKAAQLIREQDIPWMWSREMPAWNMHSPSMWEIMCGSAAESKLCPA